MADPRSRIAFSEKPILFSAPMVRTILSGAKTQTRRIIKPQPEHRHVVGVGPLLAFKKKVGPDYWIFPNAREEVLAMCPYGQPGDRLWVRETWAAHWMYDDVPARNARSSLPDDNYWFAADPDGTPGTRGCPADGRRGKWRRSIRMPRWASRITLEVTGVHVVREARLAGDRAVQAPDQPQPRRWCPARTSACAAQRDRQMRTPRQVLGVLARESGGIAVTEFLWTMIAVLSMSALGQAIVIFTHSTLRGLTMATSRTRKPARSASPRATAPRKPATPKLHKGEVYVGITLHDDRPHHLILLPGDEEHDWAGAKAFAKRQGGVLPSRIDGLVLLKKARKHFQKLWYWLDEQHADAAQYAWCQSFGWGGQFTNHQDYRLRVRAVRRAPI